MRGSEGNNETFADLDSQPVTREGFIGKKWLAVVDYHA